jgi:hypothetical protein
MRYSITAHWRQKTDLDGEVKHFNPTILECDDRQDSFRIAYKLSATPGCHLVEIKDKETEDMLATL